MYQVSTFEKTSLKKEDTFWNLIYTSPKMEKKIYEELCKSSIDAFLPLQKMLRQWSDRKKMVEMPLFSRYIFVKANAIEQWKILSIKGVMHYVSFGGAMAKIKDEVVDNLKLLSNKQNVFVEGISPLEVGNQLEVKEGIFKGLKGEIISRNGKKKLLVRIEALASACYVELENICMN
jgi:transcriptional antiterminator RfaH